MEGKTNTNTAFPPSVTSQVSVSEAVTSKDTGNEEPMGARSGWQEVKGQEWGGGGESIIQFFKSVAIQIAHMHAPQQTAPATEASSS